MMNVKKQQFLIIAIFYMVILSFTQFCYAGLPEYIDDDCLSSQPSSNFDSAQPLIADQYYDLNHGVGQGEAAVTTAGSKRPIVGTFGLQSDVAITVYNEMTKTAAIVRVDTTNNLMHAINVVCSICGSDTNVLFVDLATMQSDDNPMLERIKDIIKNKPILKLRKIYNSSLLAVDARTGTIIESLDASKLYFSDSYKQRAGASGIYMGLRYKNSNDDMLFDDFTDSKVKVVFNGKIEIEQALEKLSSEFFTKLLGTNCEVISIGSAYTELNFSYETSEAEIKQYAEKLRQIIGMQPKIELSMILVGTIKIPASLTVYGLTHKELVELVKKKTELGSI